MNLETLKTRLAEAETAYHQLMIGAKEVSVNVGNFGSVTYNQTSRTALEAYISNLKAKLAELGLTTGDLTPKEDNTQETDESTNI